MVLVGVMFVLYGQLLWVFVYRYVVSKSEGTDLSVEATCNLTYTLEITGYYLTCTGK